MSERFGAKGAMRAALVGLLAAPPALAEPASLLALPFAASELRGPGSEVALAVATAGEARDAGVPRDATLAVVWGPGGAAALVLAGGAVRVVPIPPGLVEGATLAETPRDAPAASRRVRAGALTASFTGPGEGGRAAAIVIGERQPVTMSATPKPVPVAQSRIEAGRGATFAGPLLLAEIDRRPHLLAARIDAERRPTLVVLGRSEGGPWRIVAETPAGTDGDRISPVAATDLGGRPVIVLASASGDAGGLQVWSLENGRLAPGGEARGYAGPGAVLDGAALAVPTLDRKAVAIVDLRSSPRELARAALPAPVRDLAALGSGRDGHVIVLLADGRLADLRPAELRPDTVVPAR